MASIEQIVPADPASEPRRMFRPGVDSRLSLKLLVGYNLDAPPMFSTAVRRRTAAIRELGYFTVLLLERVRRLRKKSKRDPAKPGMPTRLYRSLRTRLAAGLVLPSYQLPDAPRLRPLWDEEAPGFEASRRIFDFSADGARPLRVICHIFAQRRDDVAERLLGQFLEAFPVEERKSELCDVESRLCLLGRSRFRFLRRQYWEIVIGSGDRILDVDFAGPLPTPPLGEAIVGQVDQLEGTVGTVRKPSALNEVTIGSVLPDAATMKEMDARTAVDWDFMADAIHQAVEKGAELNDDFVEDLARRRFEHAREALAGERPGPTLESSRRVVREAVEIHRIALEEDLHG